jgi:hypothetical protein
VGFGTEAARGAFPAARTNGSGRWAICAYMRLCCPMVRSAGPSSIRVASCLLFVCVETYQVSRMRYVDRSMNDSLLGIAI